MRRKPSENTHKSNNLEFASASKEEGGERRRAERRRSGRFFMFLLPA